MDYPQKRLDKIEEQAVREDDPRLEWIAEVMTRMETKNENE